MTNVHVGIPPKEWENWEGHLVRFHHFESMSKKKLVQVRSPAFHCYNHKWRLTIFPGGDNDSPDGMIAVYLEHCSGPEISVKYAFKIRDGRGRVFDEVTSIGYDTFTEERKKWGWADLTEYATIIDPSNNILNHGTLTVEVCIKPDDNQICPNFVPKNPATRNILRAFMDEKTADVIFEVQSATETGAGLGKPAQDEFATSVQVPAHKLILQLCAKGSKLASICEKSEKATPVV
eukprot:CAMPEP_0183712940 /NCGR_PEP_ID=MMETSP0737-20130205/7977_1 /TAXON_ID=385413 /ORGANISM="Thalassiosira miniscula, Strain CCMP1093" /LENGTH=233 /DNA_ID=CAMNT_0025941679 /DNA_START=293 /DNA_END=990 /DNA_ORIENTATION=-